MSLHLWIYAAILSQPPIKRYRLWYDSTDFAEYHPAPDGAVPDPIIAEIHRRKVCHEIEINYHPKFSIHVN